MITVVQPCPFLTIGIRNNTERKTRMMLRCTAVPLQRVVAARTTTVAAVLMTTTASAPSACAVTQRRNFTNLFAKMTGNAPPPEEMVDTTGTDAALRINVDDLAKGDDMPPMLQYNEQLTEAALALLEHTNNKDSLANEELQAVSGIVGMLFSQEFVSPYQQYLTVARFTDIDAVRKDAHLIGACHAVIAVILPSALAEVVIAADSSPELIDASPTERDQLHGLVEAIVAGPEVGTDDADTTIVKALQSVETGFPALFNHSAFVHLLQHINNTSLQARFSAIVNESCLAFDTDRTGRLKPQELKEALEKCMPKYAADRIVAGVEADTDGKVYYPQLAALLMRGEGPVSPDGTQPQPPPPAPKQD
jgi:hypothetical protein